VYCVYCQEEFTWGEDAVEIRPGRVEVSSRSLGPAFIADEPDAELIHVGCIAHHFLPDEEGELREALRDEKIDGVGELFQEYLDKDVIPRIEEPEAPTQPAPRGGRNRFRTRRR